MMEPNYPITMSVKSDSERNSVSLEYKFLNIFSIKKFKATLVTEKYVYLGGKPIGITLGNNGVIISGVTDVITDEGLVSPCKGHNIAPGDLLLKIDDKNINSVEDITSALNNCGKNVTLKVKQKNKTVSFTITPAIDTLSKKKKLGMYIKESISGVGTLTYINPGDNRFGALGHQISEKDSVSLSNAQGNIYKCNIIGSVKGERGKPGELRGVFNKFEAPIGSIDKNLQTGIYGYYTSKTDNLTKIDLGNRLSVKIGKAQIYTTIYGEEPKYYDIEIVKANSQNEPSEKGLVINVTDKKLIEKTEGIVQGMSGSPIIQNGKLIGAVSHVFVNDPTRGYGMYIDWMIGN